MTDLGTGFLRGFEAFLNTRLGAQTAEAWKDTGSFLSSLTTFSSQKIEDRFNELKSDISDGIAPLAKEIAKRIDAQTKLIAKMVKESADDIKADDFNLDTATRVAIRIGMALAAADEAYAIIGRELAKDAGGNVDEPTRAALMKLWSPWAQPFKDLSSEATSLLNAFGKTVLGIDDLVGDLGKVLELDREGGGFKLVAHIAKSGSHSFGAITLDQISFEAFLQFSDREIANPTDEEKTSLIQRGEKYYVGDLAILGLRLRTLLEPGITQDKLLRNIMPGSKDPKTETITAISLDTAQGLYIGDGRANERAVLPARFSFPGVELRELAIGILRDKTTREATGFELTTSIAAEIGAVVGAQVVGAGFIVDMNGVVDHHVMFADLPVTPRWPDAVGLRIVAGPVVGGGYIERVERTYKINGNDEKRVEFGGVLQIKIIGVGVSAIVNLAPDPFSLVLVMGMRFAKAIELGFGFTLNGVGGILALNRGLDLEVLRAEMKKHVLENMLFPDDPIKAAPTLLNQVADVFPPLDGGFVIGPIAELGWGSETRIVKLKVGVVIALPDPKVVIIGALSVQTPSEKVSIVDIKAEVFAAITEDYFLMFATMKGSKIGGFDVSGELGMYVQWSGGGEFEFSVGGFHPEYAKLTGKKPKLGELRPVQIDLSPGGRDAMGKLKGPIKFTVKLYFAITAGSVQLGVEGRIEADFTVIAARAWLKLDMIFIWAPRFMFKVSIEVGAEVDVLGHTIASVVLRGELEGTRPFSLKGHIHVDVWFLPTFDKDVGPITWGEKPAPNLPALNSLALVRNALAPAEAWKAILPDHAAQLVTLATVDDVEGVIAHPLAGIEATQSIVPLGVKISHIGASPVTADMVTMGAPTSSAGDAAAISPLMSPFPPGQFFDLDGEKLLARSGFESMQGGCRVAMSTTPVHGEAQTESVAYRTYIRSKQDRLKPEVVAWAFKAFTAEYVAGSAVGRRVAAGGNPYLPKPVDPPVSLAEPGASVMTDAVTGAALLGGRVLSATESALIGDLAAAGGLSVARTTVRG